MLIKKNPRLLLFALLGMTYLAGIAQIESIPVFLTGYVALVPIQIGVLVYLLFVRSLNRRNP